MSLPNKTRPATCAALPQPLARGPAFSLAHVRKDCLVFYAIGAAGLGGMVLSMAFRGLYGHWPVL